jgi:hypothetical protein
MSVTYIPIIGFFWNGYAVLSAQQACLRCFDSTHVAGACYSLYTTDVRLFDAFNESAVITMAFLLLVKLIVRNFLRPR